MNYYALFGIIKEPFASSPDPDLFFYSVQHHDCLQKLELALRLRRGLSVVVGDIGTGKSTMCRTLVRMLDDDLDAVSAHIFLDPAFTSSSEFLAAIIAAFSIKDDCDSEWQMKEAIKNYLLHQGVERNVIPVLIIDEGQKLPGFCIEILREFLNFETNQNKLLEIVIFAQQEFTETLKAKPNFSDRITTYHKLGPMTFKETRQMVRYRIDQCREDGVIKREIFPFTSLLLIYLLSKGYPRKIVMLCSKILLAMVVKEKKRASLPLVWNCARETSIPMLGGIPKSIYASVLLVLLVTGLLLSGVGGKVFLKVQGFFPETVMIDQHTQAAVPSSEPDFMSNLAAVIPGPAATPVEIADSQPALPQVEKILESSPPTAGLAAPETRNSPAPPPEELGHLTVQDGMSMSWMLSRVYGRYKPRDLRRVLQANPYLTDPGKLKPGSKIFFPPLPDSETSKLTPLLISLGTFKTLQEAHDFLVTSPKQKIPVRILPIWDGTSTLSFLAVLGENFSKEQQARRALASLDERLKPKAKILYNLDGIPL